MAELESEPEERILQAVAGVDLGGTAINYTLLDQQEKFSIEGLCEHPALAKQGPERCLQQIADGLQIAAEKAGIPIEVPQASSVPGVPQTLSIRSGRDSISVRAWRTNSACRCAI